MPQSASVTLICSMAHGVTTHYGIHGLPYAAHCVTTLITQ